MLGVERDVAVAVDREDVRDDLVALQARAAGSSRPHELVGLERLARVAERRRPAARCAPTGAKRSRPWNVADTGVRRQRRRADLDRLGHAAEPLGRGQQQAVVGADEDAVLLAGPQRDRAAPAADLGVDDRDVDARGRVRQRAAQDERPGADVVARDAVGEVDDAYVRRDRRRSPRGRRRRSRPRRRSR